MILEHTNALKSDVDRLLRINILSLTDEMVKELEKEIIEINKTLDFWKGTTPQDQFVTDLEEL
jgi:hypothetical protein